MTKSKRIVMREVTKIFANGEDYLKALNGVSLEIDPLKLLKLEIRRDEVESLAEKLGILEKLYQMPDKLSGGQQQRVAIARALLHRPPVILADVN